VSGGAGDPGEIRARAAAKRRWWRRLLLPAAPDVLALLLAQGEVTAAGVDAFAAWSRGGGKDAAKALHAARDRAYVARRELLEALQVALSSPVDQEDLYTLSERVDRVLGEARNALREAEVLGWKPDAHAGLMGAQLAEGTRAIVDGFRLLRQVTPCTMSSATTARRWRSCSRSTTSEPSSPRRTCTAATFTWPRRSSPWPTGCGTPCCAARSTRASRAAG